MAIELIDTVGADDANTYISLVDAEEYFSLRSPVSAAWAAAASDDDKAKALLTATRWLDQLIIWYGDIASATQALLWPRTGLLDIRGVEIAGDEIPDEIGWATAEFAAILLTVDKTADLLTAGIQSLSVAGAVSITFSDGQPPKRMVLPDAVWDLVRRWGRRLDASNGSAILLRG